MTQEINSELEQEKKAKQREYYKERDKKVDERLDRLERTANNIDDTLDCINYYLEHAQRVSDSELSFDQMLAQMENERQTKRQEWLNSYQYKVWCIVLDFKIWCHAHGKWYDLGEDDFKKFKAQYNYGEYKITFDIEKSIYEQCFGYEFEYDNATGKWKTTTKGNKVVNPKQ